MSKDPYADRKRVTFEQAEGIESLPSQLKPKELSQKLRALLWMVTYESFQQSIVRPVMGGSRYFKDPWDEILSDKHVFYNGLMIDEYTSRASDNIDDIKRLFTDGNYVQLFGFLQFVIRHSKCPYRFAETINAALEKGMAAYRVIGGNTIVPIATEVEGKTLEKAFADLSVKELHGARNHLREAGKLLTEGKHADSIRESIHAVESVARTLEPSGKLSDALNKLEKSLGMHGGLKAGFLSIYGYTSDEKGIRHPLLDDPKAKVDETDAIFMIGACAAFVSYLISKARIAGLLK